MKRKKNRKYHRADGTLVSVTIESYPTLKGYRTDHPAHTTMCSFHAKGLKDFKKKAQELPSHMSERIMNGAGDLTGWGIEAGDPMIEMLCCKWEKKKVK